MAHGTRFSGHSSTYRGKPVRLLMRDGESIFGRFVHKSKNGRITIELADGSRRTFGLDQVKKFMMIRGGSTRPGG